MTDTTSATTAATTDATATAATTTDATLAGLEGKTVTEQSTTQTTDTTQATDKAGFDLTAEIARWAGTDKSKANNLRYKSVDEVFNALDTTKRKIREGIAKKGLDKDATAEDIAEYRKANGIPEKAEEYLKGLPDDVIVEEVDKPIIDGLLERLHGKNADPAVAQELVSWYYEQKAERDAAQIEVNDDARTKTEDLLMSEWGQNFKVNKNLIQNVVAQMPESLVGSELEPGPLFTATLPDGSQLMNHPDMMKWLAKTGRDIHAPTTQLSKSGDPGGVNIDNRIAELVRMSGDANGPYWKGMQADALQKELMNLNQRKIDMANKAA